MRRYPLLSNKRSPPHFLARNIKGSYTARGGRAFYTEPDSPQLGLHKYSAVHKAPSLFGPDATRFIGMIDQLGLSDQKTRYVFTSPEEFARIVRDDPSRGMQIYWGEILARAHLTAITAILRSRHWISAAATATKDHNLLGFAAGYRGLIESAADASTSLLNIPRTLARDHAQISRALSGELGQTGFLAPELERELIHFSYARHLSTAELATAPPSHRARKVRDYIAVLEKGQVPEVISCYQALCDLTHPGASSVWMWLAPASELEIDLAANQDDSVISHFLVEYRAMFLKLLMFAFNPAIVTLNVLNYFPLAKYHTPRLLTWDLSGYPIWQGCLSDLRRPTAGSGAPKEREV